MQNTFPEQMPTICPPLRWRPLAWLATSPVAPPGIGDELRASLFNRMPSLFASAIVLLIAATATAVHRPEPAYIAWALLDATTSLVRVISAFAILRYRAAHPNHAAPDSLASDVFVASGLAWCLVLGYGAGLCVVSGNPGISVLGCLLATATVGAQCGRVPGAPRLMVAQVSSICLPLAIAGIGAPDPFLRWLVLALPAYLHALISINRQLHCDYVELIVGRQESRLMALCCPLTGLANRRAFDRALATALAVPGRARGSVVLSLDLDGFKAINDALGHQAGDLLLRQMAERLVRHVPAGCLTARLGGDEFAILAQGVASASAETLACAVLAALREPFVLSGTPASVGVSIGLAAAGAFSTPDRLLGEADAALYAAKRQGKNRFRWHDDDAADAASSWMRAAVS